MNAFVKFTPATEVPAISPADLKAALSGGREIALIDVREEGQFGEGHALLAINLPYSRLEAEVRRLVPHLSTRIVLIDDNNGVAARAALRLGRLGYGELALLAGGAPAWGASGEQLYKSINVPSKAFAELVEHAYHTPSIKATALHSLKTEDTDLVILDSRTVEEYTRFHVPGAISAPSAELVYRFDDLVPSPDTLVVVSCAGRTRGIIGAQALINAGVPNKVLALEGGTQGWRLAGFGLEHGLTQRYRELSADALAAANKRATQLEQRFGLSRIDHVQLAAWQAEPGRTTTLLDVRSPEEFQAGHLAGAQSAPGGQLVQMTDRWAGVRGARLVLADDTGVRAAITAHWLKQLGWEVYILDRALDGQALTTQGNPDVTELPDVAWIDPAEAAALLEAGTPAISVDSSAQYRKAHAKGARWANRARLDRLPSEYFLATSALVFGDDEAAARLAAAELRELTGGHVSVVRGGTRAWQAAGLPVEATPEIPADVERIDFLFWAHDRHDGNLTAMRTYLGWEEDLPRQIGDPAAAGYRLGPVAGSAPTP